MDDLIRNVLPRYDADDVSVTDQEYVSDIDRLLRLFRSDSRDRRGRLVAALAGVRFVRSIEAGSGDRGYSQPGDVYLNTERFRHLFESVPGINLVDPDERALQGEDIRELLEACGGSRTLIPQRLDGTFSAAERKEMRRQARSLDISAWRGEEIDDSTLRGLDEVVQVLSGLPLDEAQQRAAVLWAELSATAERRGRQAFTGQYRWFFHTSRSCEFDAASLRLLNEANWIPDAAGDLKAPGELFFEDLDWEPNAFLQSKILFRPPAVAQLAEQAGIELGVLDLLKERGFTTVSEVKALLGVDEEDDLEPPAEAVEVTGEGTVPGSDMAARDDMSAIPAGTGTGTEHELRESDREDHRADASSIGDGMARSGGTGGGYEEGSGFRMGERLEGSSSGASSAGYGDERQGQAEGAHRTPSGAPPFISYVAVHQDGEEGDPDSLQHEERMELEAAAIQIILEQEPSLTRTQAGNPGYDLFESGEYGQTIRWVEVKAMTEDMRSRPVGLSHTQLDFAREKAESYWLYVVEHAAQPGARIVRIKNPAGLVRSYTFDHGWESVAE